MNYKELMLAASVVAGTASSAVAASLAVDFESTDVESVRFTIDTPSAYGIAMHEVSGSDSIPEPAMVVPVLGLLAGLAFMMVRRRRALAMTGA